MLSIRVFRLFETCVSLMTAYYTASVSSLCRCGSDIQSMQMDSREVGYTAGVAWQDSEVILIIFHAVKTGSILFTVTFKTYRWLSNTIKIHFGGVSL